MKTNVAIIGTGKLAEFSNLILTLKAGEIFNIKYFCDCTYEKTGQLLCGIPIVSLADLKMKYLKWDIDGVIIADSHFIYHDVTTYFNQIGMRQVYCIPEYIFDMWNKYGQEIKLEDFILPVDVSKPCLRYYEFHVCDHCNLKCKGCGHVSNISEENNADLNEYIRDMQQIKELFWGCQSIKLLGGEPLLNPQLPEFILETRKHFPETDLYVGTNGLLLPKMKDDLFEAMKQANAWFMISAYPPTLKLREEIINMCNEKGIKYAFTPEINVFNSALYPQKKYNPVESFKKCKDYCGYCFTLREGKISPCLTFYINELNTKLGAQFDVIEGKDFFNLYEENDGWLLDEKLHNPIPFCAYCGERTEFPWETVNLKNVCLSDYVNGV